MLLLLVLVAAIGHVALQGLQNIQAARRSRMMPPGTDLSPRQVRMVSVAGWLALLMSGVSTVLFFLAF